MTDLLENTTPDSQMPDVPMAMLTALPLKRQHWVQIARNASWQTTRMNLNTFQRHGVFDDEEMVNIVAKRLSDPAMVAKARAFPYQLLMTFRAASTVPDKIRNALQDAMEHATQNVPVIAGKVWIFPDVSGSMQSAVTGYREGATTAVRCLDVAALVGASIVRKNPRARVLPFHNSVVQVQLNSRDSVMTNANVLSSLPSGGTNCSAPMAWLNDHGERGDLIIYVSDNESWMDTSRSGATETMKQWEKFKARNPGAKLVCLDLQPYGHTQAKDREDILNIGGFSDSVFDVIAKFATGNLDGQHWVDVINKSVVV